MHLVLGSYRIMFYQQPTTSQTGQVTPSVFTKGDVTQLEKKKTTPCCPIRMRISMEIIPPFAGLLFVFSHACILYAFLSTILFSGELCGENLLMSFNPLSWPQVLQIWYNEERNFVYGSGGKTKWDVFGHYTQVDYFFIYIYYIYKQINIYMYIFIFIFQLANK